jgi:hypothetical protein
MSFQLEASLSFMSKTTRPFRIPSPSQQAYCRSQQASIVFRASLPSQNISSWQGSNAIQSVEVQTGVTVPWSCEQDLPHREINPIRPPQGSTNTIYQASPKERQPVNIEWGCLHSHPQILLRQYEQGRELLKQCKCQVESFICVCRSTP